MSQAFFSVLAPDTAKDVEMLSRAIYELRESRKQVLAETGHEDEASLLAAIRSEQLAAHPAYELYLAACVMEQARQDARLALQPSPEERPAHCLHPALGEHIALSLAEHLTTAPQIMKDALRLSLANGFELTARFAADDEWSVEWQRNGTTAGMSTASGNKLPSLHGDDALGGLVSRPSSIETAEAVLSHIVSTLAKQA